MLYPFKCTKDSCGKEIEHAWTLKQYESRKNRVKCECGSKMNRILTKAKLILKGGNWAADGYSSKSRVEHDAAIAEHDFNLKNQDRVNKEFGIQP